MNITPELEKELNKAVNEIATKEFYKGIAAGKTVIAKIVKEKAEFIQNNYSKLKKNEILKEILDIIKFCDNTITTTPDIERNIAESFKNSNKNEKKN